jgi:hypothetical protein
MTFSAASMTLFDEIKRIRTIVAKALRDVSFFELFAPSFRASRSGHASSRASL